MRYWTMPILVCCLMTAPGMVAAQDAAVELPSPETSASRPTIIQLDMPDGSKSREYQADEVSISISRTLDGRGDMRGDVSISLGSIRPLDMALLQWARQGEPGPGSSRRIVITSRAADGSPAKAETRYELEGARVTGFNASHSASAATMQLMLQVSARRVTLNGIVMN